MSLCHSFLHSFIHTISLKVSTPLWLIQRNREGAGPDSNPSHLTTAQRQPLSYVANFGCHVAQIKRITLVVFFVLFSVSMYLAGNMFIITSIDLPSPLFHRRENTKRMYQPVVADKATKVSNYF